MQIQSLVSTWQSVFQKESKLCFSGFPGDSEVIVSACNTGDPGLIPGLGRSPGRGNGNPLQDSCLENPMDREAWWATVHGVAKSPTWLSDFAYLLKTLLIRQPRYWTPSIHFTFLQLKAVTCEMEPRRPSAQGLCQEWRRKRLQDVTSSGMQQGLSKIPHPFCFLSIIL